MSRSLGPDVASLVSLARGQKLDLRPVILRVQTDLFVGAPVRDLGTIDAFEALATGLLPTVDEETAAIVARKLAPLEDTPDRVLVLLAGRGGAARRSVIELAPRLSGTVMQAASANGTDLGPMLAARASIDGATLAELVMRGSEVIDLALARNTALALPPPVVDALVSRGRVRPNLAVALLAREDLTPAEVAALYLYAEPTRRAQIRAGLAGVASLRGTASLVSRPDTASCDQLVEFAAAEDPEAFGTALAAFLGLAAVPDWRFERESRHELLAFALLAVGLSEEDSIRVFLTLHEGIARSVRTVFHLAHLVRSTPRTTAMHLIEATLGAATNLRPAGRHVPQLSADEGVARAAPVQAGVQRRSVPDRSRRIS